MKDKKPKCCEFCHYRLPVIFSFSKQLTIDNELLQAEDLLHKKFPKFSVHFDEYFGLFSSTSAQDPYQTKSRKTYKQTKTTQQQ